MHRPLQSTQISPTSLNALPRPLSRPKKSLTIAHPLPHPHATRLRTFRTNGVSRRRYWKARTGTPVIVSTLLGRNPRQVPQFHQSTLTLPSFQLRLPPRILFKPLITPRSNLTCLRATILILQALPQHHRHLYLYHLVQRTSQEPLYLHPAPLNP
jgi:hypothetical protein